MLSLSTQHLRAGSFLYLYNKVASWEILFCYLPPKKLQPQSTAGVATYAKLFAGGLPAKMYLCVQ